MESSVSRHDIIVIGASSGGVRALSCIVSGFPPELKAALFVVLHMPDQCKSALPQILNWRGPLLAVHAADQLPIEQGRFYVAPPGRDLLLEPDQMRVIESRKQNGPRPAIDPLFRSAALVYGPRVIGVILTGFLNDGTAGLRTVKQCGGIAVVQDPDEALAPAMPLSAIAAVSVDYIVPLSQVAVVLNCLVNKQVTEDPLGDLILPLKWARSSSFEPCLKKDRYN